MIAGNDRWCNVKTESANRRWGCTLFYELLTRSYLAVPSMQLARRELGIFSNKQPWILSLRSWNSWYKIIELFSFSFFFFSRSQKIINNLSNVPLFDRATICFYKRTILKKLSIQSSNMINISIAYRLIMPPRFARLRVDVWNAPRNMYNLVHLVTRTCDVIRSCAGSRSLPLTYLAINNDVLTPNRSRPNPWIIQGRCTADTWPLPAKRGRGKVSRTFVTSWPGGRWNRCS